MAEVYFTPGRVGVSWEIVVELAKAGSRSLMIRLARPTLTEVPLTRLSLFPQNSGRPRSSTRASFAPVPNYLQITRGCHTKSVSYWLATGTSLCSLSA